MKALYLFYIVVSAFFWARMEIEIEGKYGWAANLPTWRIGKGILYRIWGNRPLTGYHAYMNIFMLFILHFPGFFIGREAWTWRHECLIYGFMLGMWVIEDFLWFVLNPHFGIRKFRKGEIWWHKKWWGIVPDFYWIFSALSAGLIYLGRTALK